MKLLDRYLLGQFIRYFFTVNVGFVAIYLLVDFFEKIDNFSRAGKPFLLAMKFFLLNIPFIIDQIGPVLVLLSGVITLGILNHTRELNALKEQQSSGGDRRSSIHEQMEEMRNRLAEARGTQSAQPR